MIYNRVKISVRKVVVAMAKEIVLALGSGGVRGCAHIGAYRCLLDHGYKIKGISGSSAGGLFGAAFASGADLDLIEKNSS